MSICRITTIVDNTVLAGLGPVTAEHGLSFLIEYQGHSILFDTGQGISLINNAKILGIDLEQIETVVLSHGHFDHTGGLEKLIQVKQSPFTIIAHPTVFDPKYVFRNNTYFEIGCSVKPQFLTEKGIQLKLSSESIEVIPGIMTTGEIPMKTEFESVEPMFYLSQNGQMVADTIIDDLAIAFDTPKGFVVIFGCAHRGPLNTLYHVSQLMGKKKCYAMMGGLHLIFADQQKLKVIIDELKQFDPEKIIIGHCTGFPATVALANAFGNKLIQNVVGHSINI